MLKLPEKLTIRLGSLRLPLQRALAKLRQSPSEYLRRLVAADLRVSEPEMHAGRPRLKLSGRKVGYRVKS